MQVPTKFGFSVEVNPKSYFAQYLQQNGSYEEPDSNLVLSLVEPGDVCVDAGANVGYYSMLMASRLAHVIAVEPNPEMLSVLKRNLDSCATPTTLFPYAISNTDGEADFFLPSEYDDGWGSLAAADKGDRSRKITVTTRRLETLLDFRPRLRIKLIKMDVEGVEVQALQSLGSMLQNVENILIECIDIPSRVSAFGSTVEGINRTLDGWTVKQHRAGHWHQVDKAVSNGENFLFQNNNLG